MTRLGTARRPWEWTLPCVVYSVFDAQARPLYVGHTANVSDRMRSHAHEKDWWPRVAYYTVVATADRESALALELRTIKRLRPEFNVVGNPGRQCRPLRPRPDSDWFHNGTSTVLDF